MLQVCCWLPKKKRTHLFRLLCNIMQHCYCTSVATFSCSCALSSSTGIRKTFMLNPDAKIGHLSDSMLPGKMRFFLLRHLMMFEHLALGCSWGFRVKSLWVSLKPLTHEHADGSCDYQNLWCCSCKKRFCTTR